MWVYCYKALTIRVCVCPIYAMSVLGLNKNKSEPVTPLSVICEGHTAALILLAPFSGAQLAWVSLYLSIPEAGFLLCPWTLCSHFTARMSTTHTVTHEDIAYTHFHTHISHGPGEWRVWARGITDTVFIPGSVEHLHTAHPPPMSQCGGALTSQYSWYAWSTTCSLQVTTKHLNTQFFQPFTYTELNTPWGYHAGIYFGILTGKEYECRSAAG